MKCANCKDVAAYEYRLTDKKSIFYCNKHLPSFLETAKKAGLLTKTDEFKTALEEGLKNISIPTEPETVETPKPKKKATKKKAE